MKRLNCKAPTIIASILISACLFISNADIVIHITHPWAATDSVRLATDLYVQCSETNY
ncbi:MAG TPA: hypothetical protein VHO70_00810 [Chitinispirillaceae bacterium]|nr:hypothetical protein [Chitinispirillaceae bacterium]